MAKHKITLNPLSQNSIQNAIKALQSYQDSLTYKCQLLAEKLAEKGVEIARVEISDLDASKRSFRIQGQCKRWRCMGGCDRQRARHFC